MLALLSSLEGGDWARQTDCVAWDVRGMLGHLTGAVEGYARPSEMIHQVRAGKRLIELGETDGRMPVDGANAVQVRERVGASTTDLLSRYERAIPGALRWRWRLRWLPGRYQDVAGRFGSRQLFETIITRDTWIHRVDITRATGRTMVLTSDHDGRIVEDCVLEWAGRHGRPFELILTGPVGGRYQAGTGGPRMEIDAMEFMRALSGRAHHEETLGTRVVF